MRPYADRLFLIGDASGYVEPITGEGMAWALAAVESVIPIVSDGWNDDSGARWEAAWRTRVKSRTRFVRVAARVASSPMATEIAVAALAMAPGLGRVFAAPLFREPTPVGIAP